MRQRGGILVLIIFAFRFGHCQSEEKGPFLQFLHQVEVSSSWRFYYLPEWFSGLKVAQEIDPKDFSIPILDSLISDTELNYYVDDRKIFFLNNNVIITELAILDSQPRLPEDEDATALQINQLLSLESGNSVISVGKIRSYSEQQTTKVEGQIRLSGSGEPAADVYVYGASSSAISNNQGYFSIELPSGKNELFFQSVNVIDTKRTLMVYSDGEFQVVLEPDIQLLREVEVNAERERNIQSTQVGFVNIKSKDVKIVPALLGERDLIKVATLSAGIQNVGEGAAGVNVRGGKADQNLFLLDGASIYNTNHFFGFFNILNSDVIDNMNLYKNGVPVHLGGRLSSVFDITSQTPNLEKFGVEGGIGPVTSKIKADIPYQKEKGGLLLGGRTTFSDFILDQVDNSSISNNDVSFYDFIAKAHQQIDSLNEVSVTFYKSRDNFKLASDTLLSFSDFSYSNSVLAFNWKRRFKNGLIGSFHGSRSNYTYGTQYDLIESQAFGLDYFIRDYKLSSLFDYYVNEKTSYFFGLDWIFHQANPGDRNPIGSESLVSARQLEDEKGMEFNAFFSTKYQFNERWLLDAGIRYNVYNVLGPGTSNEYGSEFKSASTFTGTKEYGNEIIETYHGPEFRVTSRYLLSNGSSFKAAYNRSRQNQHLLINAASIAPTDVWRLSSAHIQPQIADQFAIGYFKNIDGARFIELSVEAYYKSIRNLLDFRTGAELQFNSAVERDILQGNGRSYGVELSLKKPDGWLNGWINYTYSRSFIRLDSEFALNRVNGGDFFPTGYDKPHYLNAVINYKFTSRITTTANLVYASGIPVTYPAGKWDFKGTENILYSDRNEFRIPDYFRVDLGFNVDATHKIKKWTHSSWTFSLYNVLGRDNVYSFFFQVEEGEVKGYKLTVFEDPIPTITYNFKF